MSHKRKFRGAHSTRAFQGLSQQSDPEKAPSSSQPQPPPPRKYSGVSDPYLNSALLNATDLGRDDAIRSFLAQGAAVDARDDLGLSALVHAARENHLGSVRTLLDAGAKIENGGDSSALIWAALNGNEHVVQYLMERGADITSTDEHGNTALFYAVRMGHLEAVETLVANGAKATDGENRDGDALFWAKKKGFDDIVEILERAARPDGLSGVNRNQNSNLLKAAEEGRNQEVQALLLMGVDVEALDEQGVTALMKASKNGHLETVHTLLDAGASTEDGRANSALVWAAWGGHLSVVELLLERGADIRAMDENGNTALFDAARMGHTEIVKTLLTHGASVSDSNNPTGNALSWAERKGHGDIVELLSREYKTTVSSTTGVPNGAVKQWKDMSIDADLDTVTITSGKGDVKSWDDMSTDEQQRVMEAFRAGVNPLGDDFELSGDEMERFQMLSELILSGQRLERELIDDDDPFALQGVTEEAPSVADVPSVFDEVSDEVSDDPLARALESGSTVGYYNSDGSFHYVQRRSELPLGQRLRTAEAQGEVGEELRAAEELYLAAASGDAGRVRHLLGDKGAHLLFALYFQKHRLGTEPPVMFFLSTLPPADRVNILEQVVADDRMNLDAYDKLAMAYLKSGRKRDAHKRLEKALAEGCITGAFFNVMSGKVGDLHNSYRGGYGSATNYADALAEFEKHVDQEDERKYGDFLAIYRVFCTVAHSGAV